MTSGTTSYPAKPKAVTKADVPIADKAALTYAEAGALVGFSDSKMYGLVQTGELPAKRIGGQVRILRTVLDKWLQDQPDEIPGIKSAA